MEPCTVRMFLYLPHEHLEPTQQDTRFKTFQHKTNCRHHTIKEASGAHHKSGWLRKLEYILQQSKTAMYYNDYDDKNLARSHVIRNFLLFISELLCLENSFISQYSSGILRQLSPRPLNFIASNQPASKLQISLTEGYNHFKTKVDMKVSEFAAWIARL